MTESVEEEPLPPPPVFDAVTPPVPELFPPSEPTGDIDPADTLASVTHVSGPEWKKHFYPYFRLGGFYDDNIFIQHDHKQADFVGIAGFGLRAGLGEVKAPLYTLRDARNVPLLYEAPPQPIGNFLFIDYSGSFVRFVHTPSENSYDQDALLSAGWTDTKLTLGFTAHFQSLSSSDIDIGNRVRRDIYSLGLNTKYELSGKTSVEANFSFTGTHYDNLISNREWLNEDWFNYQLTSKIRLSTGIGLGLLQIDHSPSQNYERLLVRAVYQATEKFSFNGRVGFEYRNLHGDSPLSRNPVFGFGVNYAPFDGTVLGLDGYRSTEASGIIAGEDYTRTGVDIIIRQRFLQRFYFIVTTGYENLDYAQAAANVTASREDHYLFERLSVAFDVTQWCNTNVFYVHQRNSSSDALQSFTDNQVGMEVNFSF